MADAALTNFFDIFLLGGVGAIVLEASKFAVRAVKGEGADPKYGTIMFWVGFVVLFIISGGIAYLSAPPSPAAMIVVQLGMNAPAIVAGLATAAPTQSQPKVKDLALGERGGAVPKRTLVDALKDVFYAQRW